MPATIRLPKGCPSSRGTSDIQHITALGGQKATITNRLYMLTVRHGSLVNKRHSLENRMRSIDQQIKQMEADIKGAEKAYGGFKRRSLGGQRTIIPESTRNNGDGKKPMTLKY